MKQRAFWIWPLLLALTILNVSGTSKLAVPEVAFDLISKDKLAHFLVFGLLATSIIRIPAIKKAGLKGALFAIICVSVFGALDEFQQSMTPSRMVELNDWLADSIGALTATFFYLRWNHYRSLLEFTFFKKNKELTDQFKAPKYE